MSQLRAVLFNWPLEKILKTVNVLFPFSNSENTNAPFLPRSLRERNKTQSYNMPGNRHSIIIKDLHIFSSDLIVS